MVRSIVALSWSAAWYQVRCVRNVADHLTEGLETRLSHDRPDAEGRWGSLDREPEQRDRDRLGTWFMVAAWVVAAVVIGVLSYLVLS